jgi:serine phosphatase RsbU (regulator of sigma subunit)/pSer/pThr/pTyr-binding forkhead associated (FHA) protein
MVRSEVIPTLRILKGPNQGETIALEQEVSVLGRDPECTIVIPVGAVSRKHAQILRVEGRFFVEDLESRNHTYINNQMVEGRTPLRHDDKIRICDFLASFQDPQALPPLPAELTADKEEAEGEDATSTTIEATISGSANLSLETQPKEKIKLLLDISSDLRQTLQLEELLPKIVDSLFSLFRQADRCFIILAEEGIAKGGETFVKLIPKQIKTRRAPDELAARFSKTIVRRCLDTASAFLWDDAAGSMPLSQSVVDFRIRSVICAPMCNGAGKPFGVIQLDTQDRNKKFTQDDLRLLRGVADHAAVALENTRLHADAVARERLKRELELAHQVQLSFLPRQLPEVPGYEFFAYYQSAWEVGGDYYCFIPAGPRGLAVLLGDVAGKGVSAALLMAKLSSEARFCLLTEQDPAAAVSRLNELVYPYTNPMDRFITLAAAFLDPDSQTVTLVNAGHLTPLLYRAATDQVEESMPREVGGLPLGMLDQNNYDACQVRLQPGDSLFLFTDGVCDAVNARKEAFGKKGILAVLKEAAGRSPRALGESIVQAVRKHALGQEPSDDIALVTLGRTE